VVESGRIAQVGPPLEIYDRPASAYVADFVGRSNLLEGVAAGSRVELTPGVALPAPGPAAAVGARVVVEPRSPGRRASSCPGGQDEEDARIGYAVAARTRPGGGMAASRRALVVGVTLALLGAPLAGEAQSGKVPRIGLLESGSLAARAPMWEAFRQGMRELGYVEGRSVVFEARGGGDRSERLPALATELVRLEVDAIVTSGAAAARAARQATGTIPIVMASGNPVQLGLVTSLARPGRNVTGIQTLSVALSGRRVEIAREVVPGASRLAILGDTGGPASVSGVQETQATAQALGVRLHAVTVGSPAELDGAFSAIARERPAVLIVTPSPMLFGERRRLAELAVKHRFPTVHGFAEYAEAGGLLAYGADLAEGFRRAPVYVDRILKGARPGDLPIEQATKLRLVLNLKTAKALGLTIPPIVLARADEIID
jgi:putative ABC transport system substrate-binding protein